ncbi:MAG: hypothetical protein COB46_06830 [Rhodospirillaceae bacterium]|nr:MAG: hypothetical protein COB46_06830 [Rhodospirillaceae bacterium]
MRSIVKFTAIALIGGGIFASAVQAAESDDEWNGLPEGIGREEVFDTCRACHSLRLVQQQGLDKYSWTETLEWMVEEQEMDQPDEEDLPLLINYLTEFYGTDKKAAKMKAKAK